MYHDRRILGEGYNDYLGFDEYDPYDPFGDESMTETVTEFVGYNEDGIPVFETYERIKEA